MNIVFRADAGRSAGAGHVMRCMALAEAMRSRGCGVKFVVEGGSEAILARLKRKRLPFTEVPEVRAEQEDAENTVQFLKSWNPDWVVVDHYRIGIEWQRAARAQAQMGILVIDDIADAPHSCDAILNQNYFENPENIYNGLVSKRCVQFVGPSFALLREEFSKNQKRAEPLPREPRRIFVCFGGADESGITSAVTESLARYQVAKLEIDVVLGIDGAEAAKIRDLMRKADNIRLHIGVDCMASLMAKADFAVGAGGVSTWERMCIGLPSVVYSLAPNQSMGARHLGSAGLIRYLGDWGVAKQRNIDLTLHKSISSFGWAANAQRKGWVLVDGMGAERVADFLIAGG